MDTKTLQRVLEPFFITRTVGEKIGIGLAGVYAIVTDLGGSITARSRLGKGSLFRILVPVITVDSQKPMV
ncbi:MAG: hypothetical protein JEZ02_13775 [Desulfatibacillum sp.]|nr:hypothetical protein [Desulfatibacillum sp.]